MVPSEQGRRTSSILRRFSLKLTIHHSAPAIDRDLNGRLLNASSVRTAVSTRHNASMQGRIGLLDYGIPR